jgi:hypothetical protein
MKPSKRYDHVFAILRVDAFQDPDVPVNEKVSVTKIVRDAETARREVDRLNGLQQSEDVYYFFQVTRMERTAAPVDPGIYTTALLGIASMSEAEKSASENLLLLSTPPPSWNLPTTVNTPAHPNPYMADVPRWTADNSSLKTQLIVSVGD